MCSLPLILNISDLFYYPPGKGQQITHKTLTFLTFIYEVSINKKNASLLAFLLISGRLVNLPIQNRTENSPLGERVGSVNFEQELSL